MEKVEQQTSSKASSKTVVGWNRSFGVLDTILNVHELPAMTLLKATRVIQMRCGRRNSSTWADGKQNKDIENEQVEESGSTRVSIYGICCQTPLNNGKNAKLGFT